MPRRPMSIYRHREMSTRRHTVFISLGTGPIGAFRDTDTLLTSMVNTMGLRWEALMIPGVMPQKMSLAIAIRRGRAGILMCAFGPTRLRRRYPDSSDEDTEEADGCN